MRLPLLLFPLLSLLLSLSLAARSTATSFCKCICFNNSTIIALNPPSPSSTHQTLLHRSPDSNASPLPKNNNHPSQTKNTTKTTPHHKLTCADCNRAFCLDYNLPICKAAKEEDVFATCFQRDSLKDETVVVVFLIATAGLLGWAVVKPWVDRFRETRYSAVPALPTRNTGLGQGREEVASHVQEGGRERERGRDEGDET